MSNKKVAVVILNWNGCALLEQFLGSVINHTSAELADVIVADNGSTDDSLAFLSTHYPSVRVIAMPSNEGFAKGYNIALSQIEHEYAVLLNSDVEVTAGWLEPLLAFAQAHPEVAALMPKIKAFRQDAYFEHAGASGGFIDALGYPFCRGRIFETIEKDQGQYDTVLPVFWATGACFFTRMVDFHEAGGLDPLFFAHMEEIDLCWRYHRMGKSVYCLPESVVYHLGGATLDVDNPRKTYLNFRNNLLMLYKNLPSKGRGMLLFVRQLLDGLAVFKFVLDRKFANVGAVYRAHRDMRKLVRSHYSKAQDHLPRVAVLHKQPLFLKSIVYHYYLKKSKTFTDLEINHRK